MKGCSRVAPIDEGMRDRQIIVVVVALGTTRDVTAVSRELMRARLPPFGAADHTLAARGQHDD
jgi:hypothetical protein